MPWASYRQYRVLVTINSGGVWFVTIYSSENYMQNLKKEVSNEIDGIFNTS